MDLFDIMILVLVGGSLIGTPLVAGIMAIFQAKKRKKISPAEEEIIEDPMLESESEFIKAKVVGKRIHTQFHGVTIAKSQLWFLITFETIDGQIEFSVSQECFERIEEGQEGTLVLVNGNFFDFGN